MKISITGNNTNGLSGALYPLYPNATFYSRSTGYDLTTVQGQEACVKASVASDVFINCSALWRFNQTLLLDAIYKAACEHNNTMHIICIGSTTDRVKNGKPWLYNAEKKALRDYCNTLSLGGVWGSTPKVSYVSFGTLTNNASKHPDRKCLDISIAARYVKWVIDQPTDLNINEISIDPMQEDRWYE